MFAVNGVLCVFNAETGEVYPHGWHFPIVTGAQTAGEARYLARLYVEQNPDQF